MIKTADDFRADAVEYERKKEESWERSDTDGFLSQWALGLSAEKARLQAQIVEAGGTATFFGLYEGTRRVMAKQMTMPNPGAHWLTNVVWFLADEEFEKFGRRFIPTGGKSRIQKKLGLSERIEMDTAKAAVEGSGHGLSGNAWATTVRTGDAWGKTATLVDAENQNQNP